MVLGCLFIFLLFIVPLSQGHLTFLDVFSQPIYLLSSPAQRKARSDTGRQAGLPALFLCIQVDAKVGTEEDQRKAIYLSSGKLRRYPKPALLKLKYEDESLRGLVKWRFCLNRSGWGLRVWISNEILGDAAAACARTTHWLSRSRDGKGHSAWFFESPHTALGCFPLTGALLLCLKMSSRFNEGEALQIILEQLGRK